jgi:anti-sigma factor RsiW
MTCNDPDLNSLLTAYVDDELDLATALRVERHLAGCGDCRARVEGERAISAGVSQSAVYHRAPDALRQRLAQTIRAHADPPPPAAGGRRPWWRSPLMTFSGIAAALIAIIGTAFVVLGPVMSGGQVNQLVDAHLRSLEADHLLDVESTDQHTVAPWFAGKVDFAPPVVDLAADGFPLIGGRLDYLGGRKVAALVYRRNKHVINVLIWPGTTGPAAAAAESKQGYNLVRFECEGMTCWAVSDLNEGELRHFGDLFRARRAAATTRP